MWLRGKCLGILKIPRSLKLSPDPGSLENQVASPAQMSGSPEQALQEHISSYRLEKDITFTCQILEGPLGVASQARTEDRTARKGKAGRGLSSSAALPPGTCLEGAPRKAGPSQTCLARTGLPSEDWKGHVSMSLKGSGQWPNGGPFQEWAYIPRIWRLWRCCRQKCAPTKEPGKGAWPQTSLCETWGEAGRSPRAGRGGSHSPSSAVLQPGPGQAGWRKL